MNENEQAAWDKVAGALATAEGIAWDECHKIYVLMDEEQMTLMRSYGYDPLFRVTDPEVAFATVKEWWDESCGLRFVSAVETNVMDPNAGFSHLIPQCAEEEWEDRDYEEDED